MGGSIAKPMGWALAALALVSFKAQRDEEASVLISIAAEAVPLVQELMPVKVDQQWAGQQLALIEVPSSKLAALSAMMHQKFHRCGGFMVEESWQDAANSLLRPQSAASKRADDLYQITEREQVTRALAEVSEPALRQTILKLSQFRNRYYKTNNGVASQSWLQTRWQELTAGIPEVEVSLYQHRQYPQPSVVLTWQGSEKPDEVVVLGGHGDSIAGWFPTEDTLAPGADDNASGVASLTELIRLLAAQQFRPQRTLKFISYAAEEVGLRGSHDIAAEYRQNEVNVVGVMQLDMTNFAGSSYNIVLMQDYTDEQQNAFLQELARVYLPELKVGLDRCGYACSDHASWNRHNYPASFPFEALMDDHNQRIHTKDDTLAQSGNHAEHAVPFVKLAAAYAIELGTL